MYVNFLTKLGAYLQMVLWCVLLGSRYFTNIVIVYLHLALNFLNEFNFSLTSAIPENKSRVITEQEAWRTRKVYRLNLGLTTKRDHCISPHTVYNMQGCSEWKKYQSSRNWSTEEASTVIFCTKFTYIFSRSFEYLQQLLTTGRKFTRILQNTFRYVSVIRYKRNIGLIFG